MSPSPSVSTSCPGSAHRAAPSWGRPAAACPRLFHSEASSEPSRHRANVCRPKCARDAHLVQRRHGIEKPHIVTHTGVHIVIGEMRIQRCIVERNGRPGIRRSLPGLLAWTRWWMRAPGRPGLRAAGATGTGFCRLFLPVLERRRRQRRGIVQSYPYPPMPAMTFSRGANFKRRAQDCSRTSPDPPPGPGPLCDWCWS